MSVCDGGDSRSAIVGEPGEHSLPTELPSGTRSSWSKRCGAGRGTRSSATVFLRAAGGDGGIQVPAASQSLARSPLLEVFISLFMDSVTAVVRGGLLRQYMEQDDDLRVVRGRIHADRSGACSLPRAAWSRWPSTARPASRSTCPYASGCARGAAPTARRRLEVASLDFVHWAGQPGVEVGENRIVSAGARGGVTLWLAWLTCAPADDRTVRAAVANASPGRRVSPGTRAGRPASARRRPRSRGRGRGRCGARAG